MGKKKVKVRKKKSNAAILAERIGGLKPIRHSNGKPVKM